MKEEEIRVFVGVDWAMEEVLVRRNPLLTASFA